jgi:hypothetical protein
MNLFVEERVRAGDCQTRTTSKTCVQSADDDQIKGETTYSKDKGLMESGAEQNVR